MPWAVLLVAVCFAAGPFFFPFAGFEADAFPNPQVDPSIQPPGWAFAIWGPIYCGLLLTALVGATVRSDSESWQPHRLPLFLSVGIGAFWLPISNTSPIGATVLIWVMLLTAISALVRTPEHDRWLLRIPVAFYAGWLTAASAVSLGIVGPGYGFAFSATAWKIIAVGGALFVAATVHLTLGRIIEYAIPVLWGFGAIFVGAYSRDVPVAVLAATAVLVVLALVLWAPQLRNAFARPDDDL